MSSCHIAGKLTKNIWRGGRGMGEHGISDPIQLSRATALFAANGRCCTTMQVSVKIETEETASSDAQMNHDECHES